ncbi:MAG: hypothetical protein RID91_19190 [Azospirillaceae bacterium]
MSIVHVPVTLEGERFGDLVSLGDEFVFYTTDSRLSALDGKVFADIDDVAEAIRAVLARQTVVEWRAPAAPTAPI